MGETPRAGAGSALASAGARDASARGRGARGCRTAARPPAGRGRAGLRRPRRLRGSGRARAHRARAGGRLDASRRGAASRLEQLIAARRAGARALLIVEDALPAVAATAAPVAILSGASPAPRRRRAAGRLRPLARRLAAPAPGTARRARSRRARRGSARDLAPAARRERDRRAAGRRSRARPGGGGDRRALRSPRARGRARSTPAPTTMPPAPRWCWAWRGRFAATRPPRTLVFTLFAGEELGLLGSAHQVGRPSAVPVERMVAMLNFDMVGRLDGRHLLVGGVDTGAGFRALVEAGAEEVGLDLDLRASGGASDHSRFHAAGVPVLFFHSGSHADYHQPVGYRGEDRRGRHGADRRPGRASSPRGSRRARARSSRGSRARDRAAGPRSARAARAARARGRRLPRDRGGRARRMGRRAPRLGRARQRAPRRPACARATCWCAWPTPACTAFADLRAQLDRHRPGETLQLVYLREGLDRATSVTLDARP